MADFTITFAEGEIQFVDLTDYSALTVTKTDLVVNYPDLTETDPITLDLYDENIATEGDSYTYIVEDEAELDTLTDGVYKFQLLIYNGATLVGSKTKYYNYQFDAIFQYLLNESDLIMDDQCCADWSRLAEVVALLELADTQSANDRYLEADEIYDYINCIINDSGSDVC